MPPSARSVGAFIDNTSLFADFAAAHDKSITFCREDEVKMRVSHASSMSPTLIRMQPAPDFMAKNNHKRHDQADDKQGREDGFEGLAQPASRVTLDRVTWPPA